MTEAVRFPVHGMTCVSCVGRVTRALRRVPGVERVRVDLRHETATVERDAALATDALVAAAVRAAGYEADMAAAVRVERASPGVLARLRRR